MTKKNGGYNYFLDVFLMFRNKISIIINNKLISCDKTSKKNFFR